MPSFQYSVFYIYLKHAYSFHLLILSLKQGTRLNQPELPTLMQKVLLHLISYNKNFFTICEFKYIVFRIVDCKPNTGPQSGSSQKNHPDA